MKTELIIFDCDGVLVDSEPMSNRILMEMLQELGVEIDFEATTRAFVGRSMADCMRIIEQMLGRAAPSDFVERYDEKTFEAFRRELKPVEGVPQLLEALTTPSCVASSGSHAKMRTTLGATGLLPHFERRMFSATEVERGKPHPDLFRLAASRLGARPECSVVVEDARVGVEAGIRAGMRVYGYAPDDDGYALAQAGARVFHRMEQLSELLDQERTTWRDPSS